MPATRLKVLWADVEEWQAREDRWLAVRTASRRAPDTLEYRAVQIVFEGLAELGVEDAYGRDTGLFVARNVQVLTAFLGIDASVLMADPLSFIDDDGALVAPWSVACDVARRAAPLLAERVLNEVERCEAKARHDAIHGRCLTWQRSEGWYVSGSVAPSSTNRMKLLTTCCASGARDPFLTATKNLVSLQPSFGR